MNEPSAYQHPATVVVHRPQPLALHEPSPSAAMDFYGARQPVVWVPDAYGRMVPMPKHLAPAPAAPAQPRDLTPSLSWTPSRSAS